MDRILYTVDEAAEATRLSRSSLQKLLYSGEIPCLMIGRRRYVRREELEAFAERQQEAHREAVDAGAAI